MRAPNRNNLMRLAGFIQQGKIWRHTDGRAIGDTNMRPITIEALKRYLKLEITDDLHSKQTHK